MKVLFVTSEAHPFLKTGGLADVAFALPKALRALGIDVRVIMPKYSDISECYKNNMVTLKEFNVNLGWRNQYVGLQYIEEEDIPFYFIDNEYYFKRKGAYGYDDDGERFCYFSKAVIESIRYMKDFKPHIIHNNDWHTAIIPVLLKENYSKDELYSSIQTILTIHNLRYQGVFSKEFLGDLLPLGEECFVENKLKYYDAISFMKGGIVYSDRVTTVSETYAQEIQTPFYGEGLDGLLKKVSYKLSGIVNGIDYDIYNPKKDKDIYLNYSEESIVNKKKNKEMLQHQLGLPVNKDIPMTGIISRLVDQKGFDLISEVMDDIMNLDLQMVILGTGDNKYEKMFKYYAEKYPTKISCNIYFSNDLSKKIYAGSDLFLMPSLFEPCGIGQLIAMEYGTLPIVRETGGLRDTVISYNEYTGKGNGFSFTNYNAKDMLYTIERAINFYKDRSVFNNIVRNAMRTDNSWNSSAYKYIELYDDLLWNK